MSGLTLDTGALIAFDRNDRKVVGLLARALERGYRVAVPAGALGQAWRDGRRQARLARLLAAPEVEVEALSDERAREAGQLCGVRRTSDVIDASVVLSARKHGYRILTSDPRDLLAVDSRRGRDPRVGLEQISSPASPVLRRASPAALLRSAALALSPGASRPRKMAAPFFPPHALRA